MISLRNWGWLLVKYASNCLVHPRMYIGCDGCDEGAIDFNVEFFEALGVQVEVGRVKGEG